jgi:hypothetical protein
LIDQLGSFEWLNAKEIRERPFLELV